MNAVTSANTAADMITTAIPIMIAKPLAAGITSITSIFRQVWPSATGYLRDWSVR